MTFPRRRRPRFNGSPSDHAATEQWPAQLRTDPADGATYDWAGASDVGVMAITITRSERAQLNQALAAMPPYTDADIPEPVMRPLDGYQPEPASFPALQAVPEARDILPPVEITMSAAIGDYLRLPFVWCEMPRCISFHRDPQSLGERDARDRAYQDGWRTDAHGLLACPGCQQTRPEYRTPQPLTWHHKAVPQHWQQTAEPITDQDMEQLTGEAEWARRINRENPRLARTIADATARAEAS